MPKTSLPKLTTTKKAFREYLEHNLTKKFMVNDIDHCVVARFMNSQLPKGYSVTVDCEILVFAKSGDDPIRRIKIPHWMNKFIDKFDELRDGKSGKVSGAEILAAGIL